MNTQTLIFGTKKVPYQIENIDCNKKIDNYCDKLLLNVTKSTDLTMLPNAKEIAINWEAIEPTKLCACSGYSDKTIVLSPDTKILRFKQYFPHEIQKSGTLDWLIFDDVPKGYHRNAAYLAIDLNPNNLVINFKRKVNDNEEGVIVNDLLESDIPNTIQFSDYSFIFKVIREIPLKVARSWVTHSITNISTDTKAYIGEITTGYLDSDKIITRIVDFRRYSEYHIKYSPNLRYIHITPNQYCDDIIKVKIDREIFPNLVAFVCEGNYELDNFIQIDSVPNLIYWKINISEEIIRTVIRPDKLIIFKNKLIYDFSIEQFEDSEIKDNKIDLDKYNPNSIQLKDTGTITLNTKYPIKKLDIYENVTAVFPENTQIENLHIFSEHTTIIGSYSITNLYIPLSLRNSIHLNASNVYLVYEDNITYQYNE